MCDWHKRLFVHNQPGRHSVSHSLGKILTIPLIHDAQSQTKKVKISNIWVISAKRINQLCQDKEATIYNVRLYKDFKLLKMKLSTFRNIWIVWCGVEQGNTHKRKIAKHNSCRK